MYILLLFFCLVTRCYGDTSYTAAELLKSFACGMFYSFGVFFLSPLLWYEVGEVDGEYSTYYEHLGLNEAGKRGGRYYRGL